MHKEEFGSAVRIAIAIQDATGSHDGTQSHQRSPVVRTSVIVVNEVSLLGARETSSYPAGAPPGGSGMCPLDLEDLVETSDVTLLRNELGTQVRVDDLLRNGASGDPCS